MSRWMSGDEFVREIARMMKEASEKDAVHDEHFWSTISRGIERAEQILPTLRPVQQIDREISPDAISVSVRFADTGMCGFCEFDEFSYHAMATKVQHHPWAGVAIEWPAMIFVRARGFTFAMVLPSGVSGRENVFRDGFRPASVVAPSARISCAERTDEFGAMLVALDDALEGMVEQAIKRTMVLDLGPASALAIGMAAGAMITARAERKERREREQQEDR